MIPLKNQNNRLKDEELGILVYGRNLTGDNEKLLRELLKTCRTQMKVERPSRSLDELKAEELEKVKEESASRDLPSGWLFDGRQYMTFEGDRADEHPNMKQFIQEYLDAENARIKAYNL